VTQAIRLVVPFGQGAAACDIEARQAAPFLSRIWERPVLVENRPDREGLAAVDAVARSAPDGDTLLWCTASLPAYPVLKHGVRADLLSSLAPIALVVDQPVGLVTRADAALAGLDAFIEHAKAHAGKLRFRNLKGSPTGLIMRAFCRSAEIRMREVVYAAADEQYFGALDRGEVELIQTSLRKDIREKVDAGLACVLLSIGSSRAQYFPEVPTAVQRGWRIPSNSWQGLLAPAATAGAVLDRIRAALSQYAADPGARQLASDRGVDLMCSTADEFGTRLADDGTVWADVARVFDVKPQ
jgi:tripartite-type tricarboxylate transporter receptor subunit TctC